MNKLIISSLLLLVFSQSVYAELHDPTRPAQYVESQAGSLDMSKLDLSLTLVSADRNVVVINDIPLKVGDSIGGERVNIIELNSVQLTGPSGNITLFLLDKSVKKPVQ